MRSTRRFLTLAATILALSALTPSVSAQSSSTPPDAPNALHATKDCSGFTGLPGSICILTASNLAQIPVGSLYIYYGPELSNPMMLSSAMVLDAGDGNTAFGYCMVDQKAGPSGMCTFWAGTGTLVGFNAVVTVTVDSTGAWHLDGTYLFAPTQ